MNYKTETRNISITEIKGIKNIWSKEEHYKMLVFMEENKQDLVYHIKRNIEYEKRANKSHFFKKMSTYLGSKTEKQCKSRYQKKEEELLRALDLPAEQIDMYLKAKRTKNRIYNLKNRPSFESTNACNSMVKLEKSSSSSIFTFVELKTLIADECLPKVQNDVIRTYLENFIQNLPSDDEASGDIPTFHLQSLFKIQTHIGLSLEQIRDTDIIYFEDYE